VKKEKNIHSTLSGHDTFFQIAGYDPFKRPAKSIINKPAKTKKLSP
jgi:hypothetical protein